MAKKTMALFIKERECIGSAHGCEENFLGNQGTEIKS
jgi:hypothetical protein